MVWVCFDVLDKKENLQYPSIETKINSPALIPPSRLRMRSDLARANRFLGSTTVMYTVYYAVTRIRCREVDSCQTSGLRTSGLASL